MAEQRSYLITSEATEIPVYNQVSQIKQNYSIEPTRDLVEITRQGLKRLNQNEQTQPGGVYVDVPRYIRGFPNVARMLQEVALLKNFLPEGVNIITNHPNYTYLMLENFPLGLDYNPSTSHILIKIPPDYPQTPPGLSPTYGIFLKGDLYYKGRPLECGRDQYHWNCAHNAQDMREKGWAWWCFASLDEWDPYKDNLFKIVVLLSETLVNPTKQRFM